VELKTVVKIVKLHIIYMKAHVSSHVHMDIMKMIPTTNVLLVTKPVVIVTEVKPINVLNVVKVDT